ncbi:hypothetical protein DFH08DRAFT_810563 [Mycena albidolilacea]|uniref:Uncharacterized protein n=1 Tax=Mycena albidolilacea TaxID=1033008 RepID=A0AAD7ERC5_9AGAR|nr:hypothetical protein DFH08DRAFT_810563 [Mycena albidolilacea]
MTSLPVRARSCKWTSSEQRSVRAKDFCRCSAFAACSGSSSGTTAAVYGSLTSALYGSLAAPKYMQTLCSGGRQHSAAANSALCSGSWAVFSGSLPYAAALLQHSQTRYSGNLTMQQQLGGNHVQVMFGSVVLSRSISAAIPSLTSLDLATAMTSPLLLFLSIQVSTLISSTHLLPPSSASLTYNQPSILFDIVGHKMRAVGTSYFSLEFLADRKPGEKSPSTMN